MLHPFAAFAASTLASAQTATRWQLHTQWRTTLASGLDDPLELGFVAAGARLTLSLDLLALSVPPLSGRAYAGLGGELDLRVSPVDGPARSSTRRWASPCSATSARPSPAPTSMKGCSPGPTATSSRSWPHPRPHPRAPDRRHRPRRLRLTFDRPRTTRDAARVTSWRRVR